MVRRYVWRKGRGRKMASVRTGAIPTAKKGRTSKRLSSFIETLQISMNRPVLRELRKAEREAREGKGVPLRSLR